MRDDKTRALGRGFFFDFRKTVTGKFSIAMIIVIILFSVLVGLAFGSISGPSSNNSLNASGYYDNNSLHIVVLATDQYGNTISGLPVSVGYNGSYFNGTSDSHGFFNATIPVILNQTLFEAYGFEYFPYNYSSSSVNSGFSTFGTVYYSNSSNPKLSLFNFDFADIWSVAQKSSSTNRSIAIFYVGPDGSKAPPMTLYANPVANNVPIRVPAPGTNISTKGLIDLGTFSNFSYIVIPANVGAHNGTGTFELYLVNSTGTVYQSTVLGLYTNISTSQVTSVFIAVISELFAFLIPLLAIFSAYLYYAKDKTNGTMESILSRPVTRGRLITSRFLSNVVVSLIALAAGIAAIDILSSRYTGVFLPEYQVLDIIWAYFVIATAFIGLVYLISQLTKSTGLVLGISIVFYIVLVLFWSTLSSLLLPLAFGLVPGTLPYSHAYIIINSFSPIGYANLVTTYLEGSIVGIAFSVTGISFAEILVVGIAWLVVPFGLAFMLARNRDWVASN
ncbi:MAG: ABC transporter permease [Candidatus Thermoplasmatota archaeon]|nr:ABC transporter permease [Candidatus Thermoplasmatota archaeon]